jgi:hypothetical protein
LSVRETKATRNYGSWRLWGELKPMNMMWSSVFPAKWTSGKRSSRKSSMSPEASAYFEKNDCRILIEPTPEAIRLFNQSRAKKIGLMHVTC